MKGEMQHEIARLDSDAAAAAGGGGEWAGGVGGRGAPESRIPASQRRRSQLEGGSLGDIFSSSPNDNFGAGVEESDDGYDSDEDLQPFSADEMIDLDGHERIEKKIVGGGSNDGDKNSEGEPSKVRYQVTIEEEDDVDGLDELLGPHAANAHRQNNQQNNRPPPMAFPGKIDPSADSAEYRFFTRDITDMDMHVHHEQRRFGRARHDPPPPKPNIPVNNAILPLKVEGPDFDDFLAAHLEHPSRYATITRINVHPDSRREARPLIPPGRVNPDEAFVLAHKGFVYVDGLSPEMDDSTGEMTSVDLKDDPLLKQTIAERVAEIFGVSSLDVAAATPTSAYVGFATKKEARGAMASFVAEGGEGKTLAVHTTTVEAYGGFSDQGDTANSGDESAFVGEDATPGGEGSIVKVTNLPVDVGSSEVLEALFPTATDLTTNDVFRRSSTTALVRFSTPDLADAVLNSSEVADRATALGKRPLRILRAKRERLFAGYTGPNNCHETQKLGKRLVVRGIDVPPMDLFLSHHDVVRVSGLHADTTLDDLAEFFQPYSADRRDLQGSACLVLDAAGRSTGVAYAGFELPGEVDGVWKASQGQYFTSDEVSEEKMVKMGFAAGAQIRGANVELRVVRDGKLRRGKREGARPARDLEELHADLSDWERHVDPEDLAELARHGVDKSILDEVMVTLRHHNRSFAGLDQAMKGERLHEEKMVGSHYRDAVRMYVRMLKECAPTEENPGLLYEAMFMPDERVDPSQLAKEKARVVKLRKTGV